MMYFDEAEQKTVGRKVLSLSETRTVIYLLSAMPKACAGSARNFAWFISIVHGLSATRGDRVNVSPGRPDVRVARDLFFESAGELVQTLNEQALLLEEVAGRRGNQCAGCGALSTRSRENGRRPCGFKELKRNSPMSSRMC